MKGISAAIDLNDGKNYQPKPYSYMSRSKKFLSYSDGSYRHSENDGSIVPIYKDNKFLSLYNIPTVKIIPKTIYRRTRYRHLILNYAYIDYLPLEYCRRYVNIINYCSS